MTWLSLLKALLLAAGALAAWLQQRGHVEAARAQSLAASLKRALDDIAEAENIRARVRRDLARDPSSLRSDDGFQRKD